MRVLMAAEVRKGGANHPSRSFFLHDHALQLLRHSSHSLHDKVQKRLRLTHPFYFAFERLEFLEAASTP